MEFDAARAIADSALFAQAGRHLSDVEAAILAGAWNGNTYDQIAATAGYSPSYLTRTVGPQLWKLLSDALGEPVSKTNFRAALQRYHSTCTNSDLLPQEATTSPSTPSPTYSSTARLSARAEAHPPHHPFPYPRKIDWGEIVDVSQFSGRSTELEMLLQWTEKQDYRLMALLGMGGVGKSSLAAKLLKTVAEGVDTPFTHIIWRSLRNAPPLETLLSDLVLFLSDQEDAEATPKRLLHWFRTRRCLVVLDNGETILQAGDRAGQYRPGYEDYGELFTLIGESVHSSCLLLTSREKPAEIAMMEGVELGVRSLSLSGSCQVGIAILEAKGLLGTDAEKRELCDRYGGNPLALKIVSSSIQDLFGGEIQPFLAQETLLFNGITRLLEQQFERLSYLEKSILYWLTINREWTSIAELYEDIQPAISRSSLLDALESLSWRSLIEKQQGIYTLQPVVMEYVIDQLIERMTTALLTKNISFFDRYALIKTTVKDYVRESQSRLLLQPIAKRIQASFPSPELLKQHVAGLLDTLQNTDSPVFGYGAGNLINLCGYLGLDLSGVDFSHLTISHAYLQSLDMQRVNFTACDFKQSVFIQTHGGIFTAAFSPDGKYFATGSTSGEVHLWQIEERQPWRQVKGHIGIVQALAWSPDSRLLASGSDALTVHLWDVQTQQVTLLEGHSQCIWAIAWSQDGRLASGSGDQAVKVWDVATGQVLQTLEGHTSSIQGVVWSPDGQWLASGGEDRTIRLWHVESGDCVAVLTHHTDCVWSLDWSADGRTLISGSMDRTIQIWDVAALLTQQAALAAPPLSVQTLRGHSEAVTTIKFSPDGKLIGSASGDRTVKLWDAATGTLVRTLQGHTNQVWSLDWYGDGSFLVSSGNDYTAKFWETATGKLLNTLQGHTNWIRSVSWHPTGTQLAGASLDHFIYTWDGEGNQLRRLRGHESLVITTQFSPDGALLASTSADHTTHLWNAITGKPWKILRGHESWVRSLSWHPNSQHLLTTSHDQTLKCWDVRTGEMLRSTDVAGWIWAVVWHPDGSCYAYNDGKAIFICEALAGNLLYALEAHEGHIWALVWHPDGQVLASAGSDRTIHLWDTTTGQLRHTLEGHTDQIWALSWNRQGTQLASGSIDRTIRLWDATTTACQHILEDHEDWVLSLDYHPHMNVLASSSARGIIRLWDTTTGAGLKVLRSDRPYEGMNVANVQGLTEAQIKTLKALGAVDIQS